MTKNTDVQVYSSTSTGEKHAFPKFGAIAAVTENVDSEVISKNIKEFVSKFESNIGFDAAPNSNFELDEIEFSLAINAKGAVLLLGEAAVGASVKIKLKRKVSKL